MAELKIDPEKTLIWISLKPAISVFGAQLTYIYPEQL
jgi:hypothetical protein